MKKLAGFLIGVVILAVGCGKTGNLFSFTHKAGGSEDAVVLVADAESAFKDGDYAKAEELYYQAVQNDPNNSEARMGYVQAYIRNSGLNLIELMQGATNQQSIGVFVPAFNGGFASSSGGYWLFDKDPVAKYGITIARLEGIFKAIIDHFAPIANGETDMKIEDVPPIIYVNLCFAHLLRGVFRVVDKDLNGAIDYLVWYNETTGEYEVYAESDTDRQTQITSLPTIDEASGKADLDSAITYIRKAKEKSPAKEGTIWAKVEDVLTKAKTMIDDLK